jgi:signal peptide peptidase SppA
MSIPHILTEILNKPLMITPAKLQVIMSVLDKRSDNPLGLDLSALAHMSSAHGGEIRSESRPLNNAAASHIEVITVRGSLVARNHGFDDSSGLRSYRTLQHEIQACMRDPEVAGILLDLDTYGGMSAGCERLARFIRGCTAMKPIYAVVDLNAYSAGYEIAAACTKVILTDATAGVGSIGCIAIHCDVSGWAEKEGLKYTVKTFGAHKDSMSPYRPMSEAEEDELQKSVNAHGLAFARTIAEFRGLELQQVLDMQAACFTGQAAIAAGLADEVATFEVAALMLAKEIEQFSTAKSLSHTGGSQMTTKERIEALLGAEDGAAAMSELGFIQLAAAADHGLVAAEAAATTMAEAVKGAAELAHQNAVEVVNIAAVAGLPVEKAAAMLSENMSVDEARETAQLIKANRSKRQRVESTTTPLSGDGKHPLVAAAEQQAKRQAK